MPSRSSDRSPLARAGGAAAILLIAALGTFLLYRHTLDYGFDYDDYPFSRPFPAAEVRAAFSGPWDATGIQVPFYRPLTIAFYAARFELFGLNSRAHHAFGLVLFGCAAALAGALVWCLTGRSTGGALAALFYVVHPSMPYAQAVWPTNQMHLLQSLLVLASLLWWNAMRARRFVWWLPLLVTGAAAFLIKEDGIMLVPVVVALHVLRRRLAEPALPPVPRTFVVLGALLIVLLLVARTEALQGLGGYARPNASRAFANFTSGLDRVFRLVPADRPWQMVASWFATLLPVAALVCWRPVRHDVRFALGAGVAIAVLFNLPFVLVTKVEQMHLVALGAAVVLSASALALAELLRVRAFAVAVMIAVAAGAAAMAAVARDISTDFDPYGPIVLSHDRIVQQWVAVPHELREYLSQKRERGRLVPANPVDTLDLVLFGVHPPETDPGGLRVRWMSANRTEILVAARARELLIPLRHEAGAFGEPASVEIFANGRRVDSLQLADGGWRMSRIALPPGGIRPLWRTHRVIVSIARAWVPARIIPGSTDTRVLGLQIGEIQLR